MKPLGQQGSALLAALTIALLLVPLGAFVALQSRMDAMLLRNLRDELDAFYVAEAGLEHAVADLPPNTSFTDVLAGPDHVAGTADDGSFPFAEGPPQPFPAAPLHYEVYISPRANDAVTIVSTGSARNGAVKQVAATVALATLPFTPAALYLAGDATGPTLGTRFALSGLDHRTTDAPDTASGSGTAVAALGTPREETEQALRSRLTAAGSGVTGVGDPPSVTTAALDVGTVARRCTRRPDQFTVPLPLANGPITLGSPTTPQLSVAAGDLTVGGALNGAGILVVDGTLRVTGTLAFTGLVIVQGAIILDPSSLVTVTGAVWQGTATDSRLELSGSGGILYSSEALAGADGTFSGLLPHAATVVGWQEIL